MSYEQDLQNALKIAKQMGEAQAALDIFAARIKELTKERDSAYERGFNDGFRAAGVKS